MGFPEPRPRRPRGSIGTSGSDPRRRSGYTPARRNFRVFYDYAGGELTNWCVHLLDVVHWALQLDAPLTVTSSGGKWYFDDCRECADTQEVVWEYPGNLLVRYSTLAHNSYGPNGHPGNKSFGSYGIMMQGDQRNALHRPRRLRDHAADGLSTTTPSPPARAKPTTT